VRGPVAVRVVHPGDGTVLAVDSTFIFGSVGTGDAELRINGTAVPVDDNGAFLAFLPVPRTNSPAFTLDAVRRRADGVDSVRSVVRLRRPVVTPLPATGALRVDSASVQPRGALRLRADERVRVSVRAPGNATAIVRTSAGRTVPLVRAAEVAGATSAVASASSEPSGAATATANANGDTGTLFIGEVRADELDSGTRLVITRARDTVQLAPGAVDVIRPDTPRQFALLRSGATGLAATDEIDRVVYGAPVPDGFYKWPLFPGTQVEVTGVQGTQSRVRLDAQLEVWVASSNLAPLPEGTPAVRRVNGGLRVLPSEEWVDVLVPTGSRPAFLVEPDDERLAVTFYETVFTPSISPMIGNDPLVRQLAWEPVATDRTRLEVRLGAPVFGWLTFWDDARRAFVLRVRRLPAIDAARPLAGLTIAVDAGHPPGGATGPTGLTEPVAVLPVAEQLAAILRERGATVLMTRTTAAPVALGDRPVMARRANAHAFLSVHLNAFGDGTNPFVNHGTSALFFHQPSEPLARAVQRRMMAEIGQRDLGVHYQSLAVARGTWFPSVLAEGLFLMFPDQEAAMRRPDWQARYARAIADGATEYFRALATRSPRE
jgi:N-acetylmuramoyl-L-alanine amidase